jgi:hypothetical protein
MQHTIELLTHIMGAHNKPCHDHQDTHQQETTHTPKVPFKCHRNTRKIPRKHNIPHACPNATKTHKPTLHNSMTNVTDHKGSAQTCRLYIGTAWAQRDAATTQHGLNIAQREPQVRPTYLLQKIILVVVISSYLPISCKLATLL